MLVAVAAGVGAVTLLGGARSTTDRRSVASAASKPEARSKPSTSSPPPRTDTSTPTGTRATSAPSTASAAAPARQTSIAGPLQAALAAEAKRYGAACFVVTTPTKVVASENDSLPLIPASTQKLLTSAAAVAYLGGDYRYTTHVVAEETTSGPDVSRIWLVGSGDPMIRSPEYAVPGVSTSLGVLADSLVASGIRHVGDVLGDDSRYDAERFRPGWSASYLAGFDVGPISALSVNDDIPLVNGKPVIEPDPAAYAAEQLAGMLRARGVVVDGTVGRGVAPPGTRSLASVSSARLRTILAWMLRTSDNTTAEMITKELGVRVQGRGSTAAGVAAIRSMLSMLDIPLAGVDLRDGSGLDRANRVTCDTELAVIDLTQQPAFEPLRAALPQAGANSALAGRVWAKGGYLTDVTGLAGVVAGGPPLSFAILLNGNVPAAANAAMNRLLDAVGANAVG